jgi:hypothetical protein
MPKSSRRWPILRRWTGMIEAAGAYEGLGQSRGVIDVHLCLLSVHRGCKGCLSRYLGLPVALGGSLRLLVLVFQKPLKIHRPATN